MNIGKLMRAEARHHNFKVSKPAIQEMISHLEAELDRRVNIACTNSKHKTIMDEDIINAFSYYRR